MSPERRFLIATLGKMALYPAIRSIPPQVVSAEGLQAKLQACGPESVAGLAFPNHGFKRYAALDWVRVVLSALEAGWAQR